MQLTTLQLHQMCPYCGSQKLILTKEGLVCTLCGSVVDDLVVDLSAYTSVEGDEGKREITRVKVKPVKVDKEKLLLRRALTSLKIYSMLAKIAGMPLEKILTSIDEGLERLIARNENEAWSILTSKCILTKLKKYKGKPTLIIALYHLLLHKIVYKEQMLPSLVARIYGLDKMVLVRAYKRVIGCLSVME